MPSDSSPGSTEEEEEEDNEGLGPLNMLLSRHYLKTPGIPRAHSTAL